MDQLLLPNLMATTELHFEIWKGKTPQNPVKWALQGLNNKNCINFIKIKIMNSTFLVIGPQQIVIIVLALLLMFGGKKKFQS